MSLDEVREVMDSFAQSMTSTSRTIADIIAAGHVWVTPLDPNNIFTPQIPVKNEGVQAVSTANEMRALAESLLLKAQRLEKIPEFDPFENGTVLKFEVTTRGSVYTYVALRANNVWWLSGKSRPTQQNFSWNGLITWMQNHASVGDIWVMTESHQLGDDSVKQCVPVPCPSFDALILDNAVGHSHDTLPKVYNALRKAGVTDAALIDNVVNEILNAGVLFRERLDSSADDPARNLTAEEVEQQTCDCITASTWTDRDDPNPEQSK